LEVLLSERAFKNDEDAQAAGKIAARGYADEMQKLCQAFGVEKAAQEELEVSTEPESEAEEEAEEESGEGSSMSEEELAAICQALGI
jgi:hypothetical protein